MKRFVCSVCGDVNIQESPVDGPVAVEKFLDGKMFFGFALADSMFRGSCHIDRQELTPDEVKEIFLRGGVEVCINPNHANTVHAAEKRFGLVIPVPAAAPRIQLNPGDSVIIMGATGLPPRETREFTDEEVEKATFAFSMYTVL